MHKKINFKAVLKQLQLTWIICMGSITALTVMGLWIWTIWLPIIAFALIGGIVAFGNYNLSHRKVNCTLINRYTAYSLFIAGSIMVVLNLMRSKTFGPSLAEDMEGITPYISSVIVYPITALMFALALWRRGKTEYCEACREQAGHSIRAALERNVFHKEVKLQIKMAFGLTLGLSIVDIAYYNFFYINVNINTPDVFFFFIIPVIVFFLSVVYFVSRYENLQFEISISSHRVEHDSKTTVRFMLVNKDRIMLEKIASDSTGLSLWDTPAVKEIPFTEELSLQEAEDIFRSISDVKDFYIRNLFVTNTVDSSAFHYAVFINDEQIESLKLKGEWFGIYQIDSMLKNGLIARPFAYEIHRVFTITMAWKTYDRNGKRLYPIKNYRPTFRISDFKDWDVDYNDLHWMNVSKNNEDRPFYKLRWLWRNYITGAEMIWKKKRY